MADGKRGLPYIERNPVVAGVEGIQNPEDYSMINISLYWHRFFNSEKEAPKN
jgi:hypothetical protein